MDLQPNTWVRLSDSNCDMHPDKGKPGYHREFIGLYLGEHRVAWLSPELPSTEHTHWSDGCLIAITGLPPAV